MSSLAANQPHQSTEGYHADDDFSRRENASGSLGRGVVLNVFARWQQHLRCKRWDV